MPLRSTIAHIDAVAHEVGPPAPKPPLAVLMFVPGVQVEPSDVVSVSAL